MKKSLIIYFIYISALAGQLFAQKTDIIDGLTHHLNYLASDEMKGRKTGTPETQKAAEYICKQFEEMGFTPEIEEFGSGKKRNIISKIPSKNGKYILIGAHFDGAGTSFGHILNAADDNASGTSVLIELAKQLKNENLDYGVVFIAYDGEEAGLLGSKYNAKHIDIDEIAIMISVDMVGHLKDEGRLIYEGSDTLKDGKKIIEKSKITNLTTRIYPVAQSSGLVTDTFYYDKKKIPTLNVFTGIETSNYHATDDDVESLDIPGMALITEHLVLLVKNLQNGIEPTGIPLYREIKNRVGMSLVSYNNKLSSNLNLNLNCMVPVSNFFGFGDLYIKPELGFMVSSYYITNDSSVVLYGGSAPLSLVVGIKADKLEILSSLGVNYSILFDTDTHINQEFGITIGTELKACNNCVSFLNKFGLGIETKIVIPNMFPDNAYILNGNSGVGIKFNLYF